MTAQTIKRTSVGLALSGGVVRGLAHVGVLAVLEEAGIPIDYVAGVSSGALIAACYCAGMSVDAIRSAAACMGWHTIARPTWPIHGLISFARLEKWLVEMLGDLDFADLKRPLAIVASDMETGRPVTLREGRLAPAVRASCSVPAVVPPARLNGRWLGDGGISNNLPVSAARDLGADYVIGVDVFVPILRRRWGPLGVGLTAIEIMVRASGGGIETADCLIVPNLAGLSYLRFSQCARLIELGEQSARAQLPAIQAALD